MSKRILSLLLCAVMLVSCLVSCSDKSDDEDDLGAYITMYLTDEIYDFDPANAYYNTDTLNVVSLMYDTLFTLNSEGEVEECIQITPRELSMFQDKGWNARKNSFVLQGYYQFRHLLFGCLADGTYFLGVPGFFHPRERQRAMLFGCPVFKESRERHWKGRFGYWCRPLE